MMMRFLQEINPFFCDLQVVAWHCGFLDA